jgi:hypothetical protein
MLQLKEKKEVHMQGLPNKLIADYAEMANKY